MRIIHRLIFTPTKQAQKDFRKLNISLDIDEFEVLEVNESDDKWSEIKSL